MLTTQPIVLVVRGVLLLRLPAGSVKESTRACRRISTRNIREYEKYECYMF